MDKTKRTIAMARVSWDVLRAHRELLLLPVLSWIFSAILLVLILAPAAIAGPDEWGVVEYILGAVAYFFVSLVAIFFNAALVFAANERLKGGDPTLKSALGGAWHRIGDIVIWAAITATISLILRAIEERAGFVGAIITGLLGFAWTLITFLVLPVLVIEGESATASLKRSASLFRETWGERVGAQIGFSLLGLFAIVPAIAVIAVGVAIGGPVLIVAIALGIAIIAAAAALITALSGIFQTALYHYATTGEGVGSFSAHHLRAAFAQKHDRRSGL
jgi:hypothetical protein